MLPNINNIVAFYSDASLADHISRVNTLWIGEIQRIVLKNILLPRECFYSILRVNSFTDTCTISFCLHKNTVFFL